MRAMKDSGVEWIWDIPSDWQVKRFRRVFRESHEVNGREPVGPMLSISSYHGVQVKEYASENLQRDDDQLETYRVVRPSQLAVNTMWLNHGGLGVSEITGHMSPAYRSYWIGDGFYPKYVHHLMRSKIYVIGYTALLTGIRPNSLQMSRENLMGFPILCPPMEEQRRIADFLDRETAKIDALIAKQEQLITTLDERRQALIMRAVTEGLDPEAPLKTEETIWFKRIPSHWKAGPLKRFAEVTLGKMVSSDKPEGDALEIPYLRAATVQPQGQIDFDDSKRMSFSLRERERFGLKKNDVVVVEGGSIGRSALIAEDLENWGYQNSINRVRAMRHVTGGYLNWSLQALESSGVYSMMTNVSTIAHLTAEKLKTVPIAVPPAQEQEEICFHLESITQELDRLAETSRLTIALLQERRQALISAGVTGKLEVGF